MKRCYTSFDMRRQPYMKERVQLKSICKEVRLPTQASPVNRKLVVSQMVGPIELSVFGEKFRENNVRDSRFPNDPQYWTEVYIQETGGCHMFTGPAYANCMAIGGFLM